MPESYFAKFQVSKRKNLDLQVENCGRGIFLTEFEDPSREIAIILDQLFSEMKWVLKEVWLILSTFHYPPPAAKNAIVWVYG